MFRGESAQGNVGEFVIRCIVAKTDSRQDVGRYFQGESFKKLLTNYKFQLHGVFSEPLVTVSA